MYEHLKEIEKGLIALANLSMVLLFFKGYTGYTDNFNIFFGLLFGLTLYYLGSLFIKKANLLEKSKED